LSELAHNVWQQVKVKQGKATVLVINRHRDPRVNELKHSLKLGQDQELYTTRTADDEGKATVLMINRHRDPRVNGLTSIDEEKQGALDTTWRLGENREDRGVTLVKLERMVDL
jgi:hypothetical protein